ncbi:unnamed protein product, partial [Tenebrio molitor]
KIETSVCSLSCHSVFSKKLLGKSNKKVVRNCQATCPSAVPKRLVITVNGAKTGLNEVE